jgi:hydroxymethylpyrimidine/phosphomethylpyrimidine kinase
MYPERMHGETAAIMEAQELKQLVKESVREALREERLRICQLLIPNVSDKEMQEIQEKLGDAPDDRQAEYTNMTDWVKNGNCIQ